MELDFRARSFRSTAMLPALFVAFFLCVWAPARAATPEPEPVPTATPSISIEAGSMWSGLTNNYGEWHNQYLLLEQKSAGHDYYASFTDASRNAISDPAYLFGAVVPGSAHTILSVEGAFSPTHTFLPSNTVSANLDHRLANGWGYNFGEKHLTYPGLSGDNASIGVDRYYGHNRLAYEFSLVGLSNVDGLAAYHRLAYTRFYGYDDQNSTTLSASGGRDVENIGPGVAVYPIQQFDISGRYWFAKRIGLGYDLFTLRQGQLYHQTGIQLGLRYRG